MTTPLPAVQCCAPLGAAQLSEHEVLELERVFKALADRHRVKILNRLLREKRGSFAYFSLTPGALERVGGLLETPAAPLAA